MSIHRGTAMGQTHVFTDESGMNPEAPFILIGGLWIPAPALTDVRREVDCILSGHRIRRQIHWAKLERQKLQGYKDLIDLLASDGRIQFNCIVIEKTAIDWQRYHSNSFDLAFNKFYFLLLSRRIEADQAYWIRISDRSTSLPTPMQDIRLTVNSWFRKNNPSQTFDPVADISSESNRSDRLLQFADLILGALSSDWQGTEVADYKQAVKEHFRKRLGWKSLKTTTAKTASPVNIWKLK